jgi:hypothetical protein
LLNRKIFEKRFLRLFIKFIIEIFIPKESFVMAVKIMIRFLWLAKRALALAARSTKIPGGILGAPRTRNQNLF